MDEETMTQIFEPFFTTKQDVGTGLGLWVTKGIVDRHVGRIEAHPRIAGESARGTVFCITLPLAGELKAQSRMAGQSEPSGSAIRSTSSMRGITGGYAGLFSMEPFKGQFEAFGFHGSLRLLDRFAIAAKINGIENCKRAACSPHEADAKSENHGGSEVDHPALPLGALP